MHFVYAVEPRAVGSSWVTFRYVIEKFGFDRGRLIAQYPRRWFSDVYQATGDFLPMQKLRVVEALNQAKKNKVVRCDRPYDGNAGNWLQNALRENKGSPFHAIIATENPSGDDAVLLVEHVDELHPLMNVSSDCAVSRDVASLSAAMKEMLRFGSRILFVDPFYDPFSARYKNILRECLGLGRVDGFN